MKKRLSRDEFQKLYEAHRAHLETVAGFVTQQLHKGLEVLEKERIAQGLDVRLFRLRGTEARVKSATSLFEKINNDGSPEFEMAFSEGAVRDLVGARIICHNLRDVEYVGRAIEEGKFPELYPVLRDGEKKKWLQIANEISGYRGWHVDVKFKMPGASTHDFAEIQIRTLLQDAWATFMHDDIYKNNASVILPGAVFEHLKHFSDLLYIVDTMAEGLRTVAETMTISTDSHVSVLEAMNNGMVALADFNKLGLSFPSYRQVVRKDRYEIVGTGASYVFDFDGIADDKIYFDFPIVGDTAASNASVTAIHRRGRSGDVLLSVGKDVAAQPLDASRTLLLSHRDEKRKRHVYTVEATWAGIFERELEYIWCPWKDLYPEAAIEYTLTLKFAKTPKGAPRLYDVSGINLLRSIFAQYARDEGGVPAKTTDDVEFVFAVPSGRQNLLCLFRK